MSDEAARRMGREKNEVFFLSFARVFAAFIRLSPNKQPCSYKGGIYGLNNSLYYLGLPEGRSW